MKHAIASLCFASALAITPLFSFAGDSSQAIRGLQWGPITRGLQLALVPELDAGALHCWIRNGLREVVSYNDFYVGYWEAVWLEYRKGADWVRLERIEDDTRAYDGVGPTKRDTLKLAPFQTIEYRHSYSARARSGTPVPGTFDPVIIPGREDVPRPTGLRSTFYLDLGDFTWPPGLLEKPVEVRVVQTFWGSGEGDDKAIEVFSPPTVLDGPAIQGFLEILRKGGK